MERLPRPTPLSQGSVEDSGHYPSLLCHREQRVISLQALIPKGQSTVLSFALYNFVL
jgi:hypothetical protein